MIERAIIHVSGPQQAGRAVARYRFDPRDDTIADDFFATDVMVRRAVRGWGDFRGTTAVAMEVDPGVQGHPARRLPEQTGPAVWEHVSGRQRDLRFAAIT